MRQKEPMAPTLKEVDAVVPTSTDGFHGVTIDDEATGGTSSSSTPPSRRRSLPPSSDFPDGGGGDNTADDVAPRGAQGGGTVVGDDDVRVAAAAAASGRSATITTTRSTTTTTRTRTDDVIRLENPADVPPDEYAFLIPPHFSNTNPFHVDLSILDQTMRCPICTEFYRAPVTLLPCLHSFCSLCIRNHLRSTYTG